MITASKLKIFERYKGDGDMFSRAGSSREREVVTDDDWQLIDLLLQDATVINRKLGSENRTAEAVRRLRESCETEDVIREIRRLATRDLGAR